MFNPELQFNAIQTTGNHNHVPARPYFPRGLRLNVCANVSCHNWGGAMKPGWKKRTRRGRNWKQRLGVQCFSDSGYLLVP